MKTVLASALAASAAFSSPPASADELADLVGKVGRSTEWTLVREVPLQFDAHHPQGMVRIGDEIFLSTVEITTPTSRYDTPRDGYDRDAGQGRGWLYRMDLEGNRLGEVELGEGDMYHPGGIDFDGESLWVPVAEYRPDSASIVYRVSPQTLEAEEVFRFRDHLGGLVHDVENGNLHAVSWGSRRFYGWPAGSLEDVELEESVPLEGATPNPAHYIDYQDCHALGAARMLCSGVANYEAPQGEEPFRLGGIEVVDLGDLRPVHQAPIALWSESGLPMTQNPFFMEPTETGIRAYFIPDDGEDATLFVYEAELR